MYVPDEIKKRVVRVLDEAQERVTDYYGRPPFPYFLKYTKKGCVAGTATYPSTINLNPVLLMENLENGFIKDTAVHEYAHLVARYIYGREGNGHGARWKEVMNVMGVAPERTHSYDTRNVVSGGAVIYVCGCEGREHVFSKRRHNNVVKRGMIYTCRSCGLACTKEGSNKALELQKIMKIKRARKDWQGKKIITYHCACQSYEFSKRRHNNVVLRGSTYTCRKCHSTIVRS